MIISDLQARNGKKVDQKNEWLKDFLKWNIWDSRYDTSLSTPGNCLNLIITSW